MICSIIGGFILLVITVMIVASTLFSMGGIISNIMFNKDVEQTEETHDEECECGCIWVESNSGNSVTVQTPVGNTGNTGNNTSGGTGQSLSELKLLGTAEMSYYNKGSSQTFDPATGIPITASGAFATSGISIAIHPDTVKELGLAMGDWVYIENIGVRQLQDICGIAGRVDVYVDEGKDSEVIANNMKDLKIYLVQAGGTIVKGLQDNVQIPTVSVTSTEVPSYGYGTGSITNTSKQLPTFKYGEKSEKVINAFLVGSVISYQVYGVYPSVMIGQKIGESGYSTTSTIPNNFYGIKADSSWTGNKGLYWTTEYYNNVAHRVQAWFREYNTFEEGVLAHGEFLVANERYAKAGAFQAKNGREQIQAIKNAGYATSPTYVSLITSIMDNESLEWFDDTSNAIYYMQQKGLYDSYVNLVNRIKSGEVKLHEKADLTNLGNVTGGTTSGTSGGHWSCACDIPCPYCHCHDNETPTNNGNTTGGNTTGGSTTGGNTTGGNTNDAVAKALDNLRMTSDMFRDSGAFHGGIDYGCPIGTPVYSIWDGVVNKVDFGYGDDMNGADGGGYGNHIIIDCSNGTQVVYAHMTNTGLQVKKGDTVKKGQLIGYSGNSGSSSGPHLHVEVRVSVTPRIVVSYKKLLEGYKLEELAQRLYVVSGDKSQHGALIQAGVE